MGRTLPLARLDNPERFYEEFFLPGAPVVISGAARSMPAWTRWTDDYLRETVGDIQQLVTLSNEGRALMFIKDYLPYLANPAAFTSSKGPVYMTDLYIRPRFHGPALDQLAADVECPLRFGGEFPESRTVYLGPRGTATPMHQDHFGMRAWMAQWHQARNLSSTVAVYGHFLPLEEARRNLAIALASDDVVKRKWSEVWSAVLALFAPAPPPEALRAG